MPHRTPRPRARHIGLAAVAATLAVPSAATALPSVFETTARFVPVGQTPLPSWTSLDLTPESRYLVTNAGATYSLRESNGRLSGGILAGDRLPASYRSVITKTQWLAEGDTGAQPHATCDVPSLNAESAILGWQGAEPAYDYVPFQATTAGLGDDPASWLPTVKAATGLTLTPATNLSTACTGLGGTFVPADTVVAPAASFAGALTAPLEAQVKKLQADKAAVDAAKAKADAEVKRLTLENTPLKVAVSTAATLARGLEVDVTGPPNRLVFVRVTVSEYQRKKLKIKYRTLGVGTGTSDAKGKVRVVAAPRKDTAGVLLKQQTALPVTVNALTGDRTATLVVSLGG
jgi:hypothetical protein